MRLCQLAGIEPAEIIIPFTIDEIKQLWEDNESWQRVCDKFLGEINSNYPKSDRINLIKRTTWIFPCIVWDIPITGTYIFYTDANKSGKVRLQIRRFK